MSGLKRARADARALLSVIPYGIAAGAVVGGALGAAYLAGGLARDAVVHARTSHIAQTATAGISEDSLRLMARDDPGALSVALRYDPNLLAGYASRERQILAIASHIDGKRGGDGRASSLFLRASIAVPFNPAAQPFHASALDETRQLDCLTQAVYYEARGETPAGQAAVAQVVINRVRHPAFPKSICAVVYQGAEDGHGCQFSFACDGSTDARRENSAWGRAQRIATRALSGYVMPEVGNATHFHVATLSPNWDGMLRVAEVGAHVFYRFGGIRGLPGSFHGKPVVETANVASPLMAVALDPKPDTAALRASPPSANQSMATGQRQSAPQSPPKADQPIADSGRANPSV